MSSTDSDGNRQPGLIALCVVMLTLAVTSVALRCVSILTSRTHKFGYDDLFAILTLPFIIAESILIFYWISLGLGRHSATLPVSNQLAGPKIIFAAAYLYDACITFPKLAVLCFYYRVFRRGGVWVTPTLWVVGGLCTCWLIGSWIATTLQCTPIRASWETVAGSKCVKQSTFFTATAAPSAILDVIILLIPLPLLWALQMTRMKKAMLTGIFICGYSVVIVSLGRLITLLKAGSGLEADLTWTTIEYICWVQCEGPISLMSVCLPNIMELGRRLRSVTNGSRKSAISSLVSRRTASSYTPEDDRNAILMTHDSGCLNEIHVNATFEATHSVLQREST
ncbi:hypothetical protein N7456_006549 [Penicillium angulare]|uniref:Rhodopsin domain-containing protein n=1 Tax=Penicillium angulare TaxID=116970 RepID=A0A9W9FHW7_9EURO|nr:hypothetical protein N7456_006549 [Penicillium angulare]